NRDDVNTADRRPATKVAARSRLARMICAEGDDFNHRDAVVIAQAVARKHAEITRRAIEQVAGSLPQPPVMAIVAGEGEFFARRLVKQVFPEIRFMSLARKIGAGASRCGPAYALAVLAREAMTPRM